MLERFLIEFMYVGGILAFLFLVGWVYSLLFKAAIRMSSKLSRKDVK